MNVNPNIPLVDICDLARELPRRDAKMALCLQRMGILRIAFSLAEMKQRLRVASSALL